MRFYVRCDICNKEFYCEQMRIPKDIILVNGLDMCSNCRNEYNKRLKIMIRELQKQRFAKDKLNVTESK